MKKSAKQLNEFERSYMASNSDATIRLDDN